MNEFKILNNPQEASYFEVHNDATSGEEEYYYNYCYFADYNKINFLEEFKKHSNIKKQAGYSKKRDCDYVSLILVLHNSGDGEFIGHSIKSTCLIKKNQTIEDSNNNTDVYDEVGHHINAVYHQLPDGKIIEYELTNSYEDELENIYESITKIRGYHELNKELPVNEAPNRSGRIKL